LQQDNSERGEGQKGCLREKKDWKINGERKKTNEKGEGRYRITRKLQKKTGILTRE
jgi:hypothetical protein